MGRVLGRRQCFPHSVAVSVYVESAGNMETWVSGFWQQVGGADPFLRYAGKQPSPWQDINYRIRLLFIYARLGRG